MNILNPKKINATKKLPVFLITACGFIPITAATVITKIDPAMANNFLISSSFTFSLSVLVLEHFKTSVLMSMAALSLALKKTVGVELEKQMQWLDRVHPQKTVSSRISVLLHDKNIKKVAQTFKDRDDFVASVKNMAFLDFALLSLAQRKYPMSINIIEQSAGFRVVDYDFELVLTKKRDQIKESLENDHTAIKEAARVLYLIDSMQGSEQAIDWVECLDVNGEGWKEKILSEYDNLRAIMAEKLLVQTQTLIASDNVERKGTGMLHKI